MVKTKNIWCKIELNTVEIKVNKLMFKRLKNRITAIFIYIVYMILLTVLLPVVFIEKLYRKDSITSTLNQVIYTLLFWVELINTSFITALITGESYTRTNISLQSWYKQNKNLYCENCKQYHKAEEFTHYFNCCNECMRTKLFYGKNYKGKMI